MISMSPMQLTRFWKRIAVGSPNACWPWTGAKHAHGYGQLVMKKKRLYAHRVAYELMKGPIPKGFEVDHVKDWGCRDRSCCNPFHLEAVTPGENKRRSSWDAVLNAAKICCYKGHPFTPENTGRNKRGHRYCKVCHRIYLRKWRREGKEKRRCDVRQ